MMETRVTQKTCESDPLPVSAGTYCTALLDNDTIVVDEAGSGLSWGSSVQAGDLNMHSPLNQLYDIMTLFNGEPSPFRPSGTHVSTDNLSPGIPRFGVPNPNAKVPKMRMLARPHEIITSCVDSSPEIAESVGQAIHDADSILLAGCVGMVSAGALARTLAAYGFTGTLHVVDKSGAPLSLIDQYWALAGEQLFTVSTEIMDLTTVNFIRRPELSGFADITIVDILGHYLTDDELHYCLADLSQMTHVGGLLLIRDMFEHHGTVAPECRTIGDNALPSDTVFQEWLKTHLGISIDLSEIIKARTSRWPDPRHTQRGINGHSQYDHALYNYIEYPPLASGEYTPDSVGDNSRTFFWAAWRRNSSP